MNFHQSVRGMDPNTPFKESESRHEEKGGLIQDNIYYYKRN